MLHFEFTEPPTNAVVVDSSGRNNHGRLAGATWTASGRHGGGCAFAPTAQFIVVPASPSLNVTGISAMAWIKAAEGIDGRTVIERLAADGTGFALGIAGEAHGGGAKGRPFARVGERTVVGDSTVADHFWHHVALVFDGRTLKLYLDGAQQKQTTEWTTALGGAAAELTIGMNRSNPAPAEKDVSFQGTMDEIRIYDRALDGPAVTAIYSSNKPRFTKNEVARRIAELKELKERGLLLDDFFERKMKECEQ